MLLARVEGHVVATHKHKSLVGQRLLLCQPLSAEGAPEGAPVAAIDSHGAGMHQLVIVSGDGAGARRFVGDPKSPVRHMVVGVVDEVTGKQP
jgi:microcompartment protein CcmK/EutM